MHVSFIQRTSERKCNLFKVTYTMYSSESLVLPSLRFSNTIGDIILQKNERNISTNVLKKFNKNLYFFLWNHRKLQFFLNQLRKIQKSLWGLNGTVRGMYVALINEGLLWFFFRDNVTFDMLILHLCIY